MFDKYIVRVRNQLAEHVDRLGGELGPTQVAWGNKM